MAMGRRVGDGTVNDKKLLFQRRSIGRFPCVSRLNGILHIVGYIIPAKRHKKGKVRNGNSRNNIEDLLSNRLKINGIFAYYSISRHFPF